MRNAILIFILLLLSSCEKIVKFNEDDVKFDGLVVNALASTDSVFSVSVTKAYPFYNKQAILGGSDHWVYQALQEEMYEQFYRDSATVADANVSLSINHNKTVTMSYDKEKYCYVSSYIPQSGDCIKITIENRGISTTSNEIEIPNYPHLEIMSYTKMYSPKNSTITDDGLYDSMGKDTIARVTLKICDPSYENNFYRLKVRSYALSSYENGEIAYIHNDIFTSDNEIFFDNQLFRSYRGWPAFFSNVFSDQHFNGENYEFTVESRLRRGDPYTNHLIIELQSITKDLYYYLKSTMLYRITEQDAFTEPIHIHSNIKNGWGILGGLSSDKHIIYL